MGGGSSKQKASEKSDEVEKQIIARQQQQSKTEMQKATVSPSRSKSVAAGQKNQIPDEWRNSISPGRGQQNLTKSPNQLGANKPMGVNQVGVQSTVSVSNFKGNHQQSPLRVNNRAQNIPIPSQQVNLSSSMGLVSSERQPQAQPSAQPSRGQPAQQPRAVQITPQQQQMLNEILGGNVANDIPPEVLLMMLNENGIGTGAPQAVQGRPNENQFQDDIDQAIIQSIFEQEQNAEEEKLLREVMKISALEHQKQIGALNLDHLKKKSKKTTAEDNGFLPENKNVLGQLAHVKSTDLKPIEIGGKKAGAKLPVLPPPKVNGKLKRDQDDVEDQKFLALISEGDDTHARNNAQLASNQYASKQQWNNEDLDLSIDKKDSQPPSKMKTLTRQKNREDDEDDFNEILKTSPKKKPNQQSHFKDREWENLEAMISDKKRTDGAGGGYDDLLNDDEVGTAVGASTNQSPQRNLNYDMMQASSKKPQPFSKGLSLIPAPMLPTNSTVTQSDKYLNKQQTTSGVKNKQLNLTYGTHGDDQITETTKANERSKPTLEESTNHYDIGGDEDDFDKLMGHLDKNQGGLKLQKPNGAATGGLTTNAGNSKRNLNDDQPLINDEYEDFF